MAEYSLFSETPALAPNADSAVTVGTEFQVDTACWIVGFRYLQPSSGSTAPHTAAIYNVANGTLVAGPLVLPAGVAGQWVVGRLATPVALPVGNYRAATFFPNGDYPYTAEYFTNGAGNNDLVIGPITRLAFFSSTNNRQGSYAYGSAIAFPNTGTGGGNFWADAIISDTDPGGGGLALEVTAALSGDGTLTLAGRPWLASLANLSGDGTLGASGTPALRLSVGLSGDGTLSASTTTSSGAALALSGAGTLSAAGSPNLVIVAALSGSGDLTATASAASLGAADADLSGSGSLATTVVVALSAEAELAGSGLLAFDPTLQYTAWVAFDSAGQLDFEVSAGLSASADLSGEGALEGVAGDRPTADFIGSSTGTLAAVVRPAFAVTAVLGGLGSLGFSVELSGRDVIVTAYLPDNTRRRVVLPDNRWEAHL